MASAVHCGLLSLLMIPVDFPWLPQFSWGHGGSSVFWEQREGRLFRYCLVPTLKCGRISWASSSSSSPGLCPPQHFIFPEWLSRHHYGAIGLLPVPQLSASFGEPCAVTDSTGHPPVGRVDALSGAQCSLHVTRLLLPFLPYPHRSPWTQHRHRIQTLFFSHSSVRPPLHIIRAKRYERGDHPQPNPNPFLLCINPCYN